MAALLLVVVMLSGVCQAQQKTEPPVMGMYVHEHWPYNHPYAARTWTLEDWRGYADGLHRLGFNTIMIWPMVGIMPDPPTSSDLAALHKTAQVIDMLHKDFGMRVVLVLGANVVPKDEVARKAAFEKRHFYYTENFINPADPAAVADLMRRREKSLRFLKAADAFAIIDSDPGGYPNSSNSEFVNLLKQYRKLFDKLRPGIELIYWVHVGWPGYGRWYATGKFGWSTPEEYEQAVTMASQAGLAPWGLAGARRGVLLEPKWQPLSIAFNYGVIEHEPSFPLTNFEGNASYEGGKGGLPRGVMGNAENHCLQLPNTFAFARGATGKSLTDADFAQFANDLLPGQGKKVVAAWKAIAGDDPAEMRKNAEIMESLSEGKLSTGPLGGLLFGSPQRFLDDLSKQLDVKAAYEDFLSAQKAAKNVGPALGKFVAASEIWQKKTGYENYWGFLGMTDALRKLNVPEINHVLAEQGPFGNGTEPFGANPGATPYERIENGFANVETYTPQLLRAMKKAVTELNKTGSE